MICVVIKGPSFKEVEEQIQKALPYADLLEFRLDFFESLDLKRIQSIKDKISIPIIFTFRSQNQDILRLSTLKPAFIDIEEDVPEEIIWKIPCKVILSYHNFKETPKDLELLLQQLRSKPAFYYKMAVMAQNSVDALRLLTFAKHQKNLIAISMGEHGQISRILAPIVGSPICYAAPEENQGTAPGQLLPKHLLDLYRYKTLRHDTEIFGLIGDPVHLSISDRTHNHLIKKANLNAVYVKMEVKKEEISAFFKYVRELPFKGLSVTMPLKEEIFPFMDEIDEQAKEIGAINTIFFQEGKVKGFNTDGKGALDAIERVKPVKGKKMLLLGAGGASKAIALEAKKRGAKVLLLCRNPLKVQEKLGCEVDSLDKMGEYPYDILVNCTPHPLPIHPEHILENSLIMEIKTIPHQTDFTIHGLKKGCQVIYGHEMFVGQAALQFSLWLNQGIPLKTCHAWIHEKALECLI